ACGSRARLVYAAGANEQAGIHAEAVIALTARPPHGPHLVAIVAAERRAFDRGHGLDELGRAEVRVEVGIILGLCRLGPGQYPGSFYGIEGPAGRAGEAGPHLAVTGNGGVHQRAVRPGLPDLERAGYAGGRNRELTG